MMIMVRLSKIRFLLISRAGLAVELRNYSAQSLTILLCATIPIVFLHLVLDWMQMRLMDYPVENLEACVIPQRGQRQKIPIHLIFINREKHKGLFGPLQIVDFPVTVARQIWQAFQNLIRNNGNKDVERSGETPWHLITIQHPNLGTGTVKNQPRAPLQIFQLRRCITSPATKFTQEASPIISHQPRQKPWSQKHRNLRRLLMSQCFWQRDRLIRTPAALIHRARALLCRRARRNGSIN